MAKCFRDITTLVLPLARAGGLVINEDLAVYEITKSGVRHRKRIVPERSWGVWSAERNWDSDSLTGAAGASFGAIYY